MNDREVHDDAPCMGGCSVSMYVGRATVGVPAALPARWEVGWRLGVRWGGGQALKWCKTLIWPGAKGSKNPSCPGLFVCNTRFSTEAGWHLVQSRTGRNTLPQNKAGLCRQLDQHCVGGCGVKGVREREGGQRLKLFWACMLYASSTFWNKNDGTGDRRKGWRRIRRGIETWG